MKRFAHLCKALRTILLVLLLFAVTGAIGLWLFLSSAAAARLVAEHLQKMLGGRIEIQSVQISLTGSSRLHGIEVYEDDEADKPWLSIGDATAEVSVLSLLRGQSPHDIYLQEARLLLRFDSDGRLLTKLPTQKKTTPARLPNLHLDDGELDFDQQQRSPMIVRGIHADLASGESGMILIGSVSDPVWGNWKVNGNFDNSGNRGSITLDTEQVAVTMAKLKSIPFVPSSVWREIHIEGTTPALVRLNVEPKVGETSVHYRVEVSPQDAQVRISAIGLEATHAHGKAILADEVVQLDHVRGRTAGGSITVSGKLNFHDEPTRLSIQASVQDVVLRDLPRSWDLPNDIDGRLSGLANLVVTIRSGKIETAGSGEGVIRQANWNGFAINKPVRLMLRSENGRYRFHQPETVNRTGAAGMAKAQKGPNYPGDERKPVESGENKPEEVDVLQNAPTELVELLDRVIKLAANGLCNGIDAAVKMLAKLKQPSAPDEGPTYLDVDLNMQDVDLAQLLQKLKLNLPYSVTGRLSFQVHASIPINKAGDLKAYRLRGAAKLASFNMAGLTMTDIQAKLYYADGVLHLERLHADVEGASLTGRGELQLLGACPFKAELHLDHGELKMLNRLAPAFRPPFELRGRTQLDGTVSGTLKPLQFDTKGQLQARDLVVERFTVDKVSFRWSKDKNDLNLDDVRMELYGGSVTGSARLPLDPATPGSADLVVRNLDVQAMAKALPAFPVRLEGKVSGIVQVRLSAAEGDQPRAWTSELEVAAPELRVQGVPAERVKGTIYSHSGKIRYNLQGETLGGTFILKGDLPAPAKEEEKKRAKIPKRRINEGSSSPSLSLRAGASSAGEPGGRGHFELRNAQLSRLWPIYGIAGLLARLDGRFSIILDYRHIGLNMAPLGDGTFQIVDVRCNDEVLGAGLQGNVQLTANAFQLDNVTGDVAGGLFFGWFGFGLKPNGRSWFRIDLQQVEASRLLVPLPPVAAHVKGPVDVELRGSIGRHWDGSGGVTLTRGQIYGMEIAEWRIPLTFSFSPSQGSGELAVRGSQARLAQGRARFEGTMNWGNGLRLVGLLLYYDVDLRTLLRSTPGLSSYASGRMSGRIDLAGNEMRSLNDLTAVVQTKMKQGQALQMPVLRQITPYLRPGASSATFQSGELKGRLAGGVFRIESATLVGDFIKMLVLGTINLAGSLDLDVTAQTGLYGLNAARTNAVSSRIPLAGAIPRLVLYEANTLLGAAVVHLHVTGTVNASVVRLEPLVALTEDAIRFFLGRTIGLVISNLP